MVKGEVPDVALVRPGCPDPVSRPRRPLPTVRGQRVLPSPFLQDHSVFARRNQFGTFKVKTETSPKFQKTKTIKTEQKTTDKLPTAGQRVVHFRALAHALAIIGVAAACELSVPAPLVLALHTLVHTAVRVCVVPHLPRRTHL